VRALLVAALVCASAACHDRDAAPIPMTPTTPTPVVADVIEYRVTGQTGGAPVSIKYTDSINGLSILPAVGLPYFASVQSTDAEVFIVLEASANAVSGFGATAVLEVQIFINGRLFREAYATGFGPLYASASGTWRR